MPYQLGHEIHDMYSMHYSEIPKNERRAWLMEKFLFHCDCQACKESWPTYDGLPKVRKDHIGFVNFLRKLLVCVT